MTQLEIENCLKYNPTKLITISCMVSYAIAFGSLKDILGSGYIAIDDEAIGKCVRCLIYTSRVLKNQMADSPVTRKELSLLFTHVSMYFNGFTNIELKQKQKQTSTGDAHLCIFVGHLTKCQNMEVVEDPPWGAIKTMLEKLIAMRQLFTGNYSVNVLTFVQFHGRFEHSKRSYQMGADSQRNIDLPSILSSLVLNAYLGHRPDLIKQFCRS
jgi:hypothetical protein